ncbi:MAG: LPS assembly protein LptD [Planctomycetes bacterium]|nr:LPS assembly protein LptD [Planctomycetota bacterium]MCB9884456.1 LPS assembly protein LptD [Planctomycetota bacterium]
MRPPRRSSTAILLVLAAGLRAQQGPGADQTKAADGYIAEGAQVESPIHDDFREMRLFGGFRFVAPHMGLDIRGKNAVLLFDLAESQRALERRQEGGLPHRDLEAPATRRRLSPEQIRAKVDRSMRALGQTGIVPEGTEADRSLELLRYLYCEGGITVVQNGVEVLRCERLWVSPLDDRIVVEDAELRYLTPGAPGSQMLIVRGPRLVKQGSRWTGRDVTVTTCTAAEPHAALAAGEIEIIERVGEYEIRSHGQTLQVGGTSLLPLPDAHIFTGNQAPFPIRRLSGGYSSKEGWKAEVGVGLPWNKTGGELHHWLTGRPAEEFRGDWEVDVGWIQERGVPLRGQLEYSAADLYRGRTEGYWLDDRGEDIREILNNLDGSPIDNSDRGLLRTENKITFDENTYLDVQAFYASDPAVYSEFFAGPYRSEELPETGFYLHHSDDNRLLTVGTRFSLTDFSYRDNRALADRFVEELPVVTYNWYAQPIGEMPWGSPIIVDLATEFGERRSAYDDRSTLKTSDGTFRADQKIEISSPMHWGPVNVRPYVLGRGTWYDNTVGGDSDGRLAMEAGVEMGTRLSRSWSWLGDDSDTVRHVIAPRLLIADRFHVSDDPSSYFQFDGVDALTEQTLVRVEVRNLFQRMERTVQRRGEEPGPAEPRDFLFLDLAQDFWPDATRDNGGDTLGLAYFDFLVRPTARWLPFQNFAFAVYGDYDWQDGLRTLDTELRFGPLAGIQWILDYRADTNVQGAVRVTGMTSLFDRWNLYASSQRDLNADEWLNYSFGLRRNDHDWSILSGVTYNPFTEDTTFSIEFVPRFGGMGRGRVDRFGGNDFTNATATGF